MPWQEHGAFMSGVPVHLARWREGHHRNVVPDDEEVISAHLLGRPRDSEVDRGRARKLILEQLDAFERRIGMCNICGAQVKSSR